MLFSSPDLSYRDIFRRLVQQVDTSRDAHDDRNSRFPEDPNQHNQPKYELYPRSRSFAHRHFLLSDYIVAWSCL